jgi:hypothetical protein
MVATRRRQEHCHMLTHRFTTSIVLTTAAIFSLTLALAFTMATPSVSKASDGTSGSVFVHPDAPWLCYSRLAGYKFFQYSNCTGKSYPA